MDRGTAALLTVAVGGLIALQPAVNAGLGDRTGSLPAALISFAVGTLALAIIVGLSGQTGSLGGVREVSWIYLTGGLMGAILVTVTLITVREIGAGGVAAAMITGQLTLSMLIDRLGILGLSEQAITADRVFGVALLLAGTYLVVR